MHSERPWSSLKIRALFEEGWFSLRAKAYDRGQPELTLDPIQLERSVCLISDARVRAAAMLYLQGMDQVDIGYVLGGRGRSRTGSTLVRQAMDQVGRQERLRYERLREG